jgi:hypothetical protein
MSTSNFDIAIIGAGAAGLHLALAMKDDSFFQHKSILILEKSAKDQNDRTWCFWEKGEGLWDSLLQQSWSKGDFFTAKNAVPLSLAPYRYKMLRAIDFYEFAKKEITASPLFHWVNEDVQAVKNGTPIALASAWGRSAPRKIERERGRAGGQLHRRRAGAACDGAPARSRTAIELDHAPRARCELDHAFPGGATRELDHAREFARAFPGGATRELDHAREFAPVPAPPFRAAREFDRGSRAGRITDACQPGAGTSLAYRGPTGARG